MYRYAGRHFIYGTKVVPQQHILGEIYLHLATMGRDLGFTTAWLLELLSIPKTTGMLERYTTQFNITRSQQGWFVGSTG